MRYLGLTALVCLAAFSWMSCSEDLESAVPPRNPRSVPASYENAGLGFDPGLVLTHPISDAALAGASIPRPGGGSDLLIGFVAFVTRAAADDADGQGAALDRSTTAPPDTNAADDVFLAAVVNLERVIKGRPQPVAFTQGLANIFRDPRCVRCHSFHYPNGWRVNGHVGNIKGGTNASCSVCHENSAVLVPGLSPAAVEWIGPDVLQVANPTQDLRGKSDREFFDLLMTTSDPADHLQNDERIRWAIAHGRVPFRDESVGGRVPLDPQQWDDLAEAWSAGGMLFSTDSAVQDIVAVSQKDNGPATGNGRSFAPSIAFQPNAAFSPANPTAVAAGWVQVAFASDATDLIAGTTSPNRDVYRTAVAVWFDANGNVDLRFEPTMIELASASTTVAQGGDADSDAPSVSADGDQVAFQSLATDLIAGFGDVNGATQPDIFVRDVPGTTTILVSRTSPTQGGNGGSFAPAVSSDGAVVAFESDAADLVAADTNGLRDVFYARDESGSLVIRRASVQTGGGEGTGGSSTHAGVWQDAATNAIFVAFQSNKIDLVAGGNATVPAVYIHDSAGPTTTRLGDPAATATEPVISPEGSRIAFLSTSDLDPARTDDNGVDDVFVFDLAAFRAMATTDIKRLSLHVTGSDADGASRRPMLAGFRNLAGSFQTDLLLEFGTVATNLGRSPHTEEVLQFLVDRTNPRTVAEFSASPLQGIRPVTVDFVDLSSNATSWMWDFGDGNTSNQQNPVHTYTAAGSYDVTLMVTGGAGSDTRVKTGFVTVGDPNFQFIWTQYFSPIPGGSSRCSTCHTLSQGSSRFSMTTETTAYNNLVNINSVVCPGRRRVLPNNASLSVLIDILSESGCVTNHTGGSASSQALADIRDWINAGAVR